MEDLVVVVVHPKLIEELCLEKFCYLPLFHVFNKNVFILINGILITVVMYS